jgi:hypothetical protein
MRGRSSLVGLVGLAGLVCTACPNPNTFTTARTVPVGEVSHSLSIETIGYFPSDEAVPDEGETEVYNTILPTPPSYTARIGVAEQAEVGLHFSHLSSIGADFKWNPVRSEAFDLAIDPGGNFGFIAGGGSSAFLYYLQLPVLLDLNLSPSTSIVFSPGMAYYGATGSVDSDFASDGVVLARVGLGFDFRTSKKFAVHPEVTVMLPLEDEFGMMFLGGIGFNFGSLPDFGQ